MNLLARIKAAFSSEKYQSSSMAILRGQDTKRASFDNRSAVLAYRSWIFAAANLNAVAVASQPLRLYVKNRSAGTKVWRTRAASRRAKAYLGGSLEQLPSRYAMTKAAEYGDDYEVVEDSHPILTLLSKVNPYQNGFDATVLRVLFGELTGNAYVHPVLDPRLKIPVELWTMPSQYVEIMPGQSGEEFIKGYRYGATEEQKRENFYPPDEVIHFRRPNPSDLYYGMGKVEAAWGATIANEALHEMDTAFFANKARPDYLLVVKSSAHPDELERLEVSIDEKLRGSKRTGRFLTTTADIDLKPLSFPPKDLTGREQIVEEIAAVFGVPVSMLKANDPNLASATVGFASWKQTTILPLLRMDEETLNQNLLPLFGIEDDAFLAYDNPVSEDERFAFEKLRSMVAGGIMTANEARMREGLEAVEDPMADALLVNGQPLGGPAPAAPLGLASAGPDGLVGPLDRSLDLEEPPQAAEPYQNAALTFEPMPEPERKDALSDCVSEKIPKLLDEGYPQDQAVAIAYSMCRDGKSLEEAATALGISAKAFDAADVKALGDIDTRPPQGVADNARRALEVRARKPESERGMTAVGIARARDLANRVSVSEDTIRRMLAYFERHEVDKQGASWDEQGKGWQAWNGWGGDDGWAWARRKVDEFNRERERNAERKKKSCGCGCSDSKRVALEALWTKAIEADEIETPHIFTKAGKDALREFDKITEREEQVGKSVGRVLDKQVRAVLEKIEKAEAPTAELAAEVETLLQSKRWRKDIVDALRPYLEDSLVAGIELGKRTLEKMAALPATFDKRGDDLKAYARTESIRFSNRAADAVNRYTAVKFSKVIGDGVANGETIPQIAERVKVWAVKDGDGERATTRRAITIARTEAQRASRSAEVEAWKSSGVVTGKTWLLAPDPCEFCEAASDAFSKNAVGLEDSFYGQGSEILGKDGNVMVADYENIDGPPLHPNCRCSLQPVLDDESEAILREAEAELKAEMEAIDKQSIRENREIYERAEAETRRIMED